jgi:site-specific DNA recombinase
VLDRLELDKLRLLAKQGAIGGLIVYAVDRMGRRMVHQLMLEDEFKKFGVSTEYVLAAYDDSPDGRFQKQIRAAVSELEREKILERAIRGKKGRASAGYCTVALWLRLHA